MIVDWSDGSKRRNRREVSGDQASSLRMGTLLDDPGLQRVLGLGAADVAAAAGARIDGRMASMLRVARYDSAA